MEEARNPRGRQKQNILLVPPGDRGGASGASFNGATAAHPDVSPGLKITEQQGTKIRQPGNVLPRSVSVLRSPRAS